MRKSENRSADGEFLTITQTAQKSNLGTTTVRKIARESNSLLKIGGCSRIRWDKFYAFVCQTYGEQA